jgi:hypothetical protein
MPSQLTIPDQALELNGSYAAADRVGIGERAAQKIIADLVADGYITRTRDGRRNRYTINRDAQLRHPIFSDPVGALVDALSNGKKPGPAR